MKTNNDLDLLKSIKKAEAPPFLYTRIVARIQSIESERIPGSWAFTTGIAFSILVILNSFVLVSRINVKNPENIKIEAVAKEMHLTHSNQLYNE
jgi:hypothetical protein